MSDRLAFMELVTEPAWRRCWLLYRALDCLPLDQAIDWAQQADNFITLGRVEPRNTAASAHREPATPEPATPEPATVVGPRRSEPSIELPTSVIAAPNAAAAASSVRSTISAEQRRRLIDRLATGAKNSDLAAEFGMTPKQVQGVRIGCSREIAARRGEASPRPAQEPPASPRPAQQSPAAPPHAHGRRSRPGE